MSADLEKKIEKYTQSFTVEEAKQKLVELETEKRDRIEKAGFTDRDFATKSIHVLKIQMQRVTNLREGNTTGLFNRYLSHQQKVNEKNKAVEAKASAPENQKVKEVAVNNPEPKPAAPVPNG